MVEDYWTTRGDTRSTKPNRFLRAFVHGIIAVVATDNLCAERRERNPALLMTASGIAGLSSTTLPQIVIDAIEDCAFGSRFLCGQLHL